MSAYAVCVTDWQQSDDSYYGPFRTEASARRFADAVEARATRLHERNDGTDIDQTAPHVYLVYLSRPSITGATGPWEQ